MNENVGWGLIAAGGIAKAFARGVARSETGTLKAIASRTAGKAKAFAAEFDIPRAYAPYEALLEDPDIEAVYISTPHPHHVEWAVKAAEAGKHLLVEKPIGINRSEANTIIDAAAAHDVFLMEAYMYRCHPQTARVLELIRRGAIGDVRVIQATFSFNARFDPASRTWNNALAGGGILDVGGYTTSYCRLIAGAAMGMPLAEPVHVGGAGYLHPETGVDAWAVGTLRFDSGIVASIAAGVGVNQDNVVRIFGSEGHILLPDPYVHARDGASPGRIVVARRGEAAPEEIVVESAVTSFAHEADVVGNAIRAGLREAPHPAMTWADTLENLGVQDAWRAAIGLVYRSEKPRPK
jgi:predicted dehydrogenase